MVDMKLAEDTDPVLLLPGGHMDSSVDLWRRPSRWSESEGHVANELYGTPNGIVGHATKATAQKAKRPVLAIMKYLVMLNDEFLDAYPPGTVPDAEKMTTRTNEELAPYLKEPLSKGWRTVYGLSKLG
jgi:creatinine amidohydrolase